MVELLRLVLVDSGYRVVTSVAPVGPDLERALASLARLRPRAAVLAVPRLGELCSEWISRLPDIVPSCGVIIASPDAPAHIEPSGTRSSGIALLPMPFDIDHLSTAVARAVQPSEPEMVDTAGRRPRCHGWRPSPPQYRLLIDILTDLTLLAHTDPEGAVASLVGNVRASAEDARAAVAALASARTGMALGTAVAAVVALLLRRRAPAQ